MGSAMRKMDHRLRIRKDEALASFSCSKNWNRGRSYNPPGNRINRGPKRIDSVVKQQAGVRDASGGINKKANRFFLQIIKIKKLVHDSAGRSRPSHRHGRVVAIIICHDTFKKKNALFEKCLPQKLLIFSPEFLVRRKHG